MSMALSESYAGQWGIYDQSHFSYIVTFYKRNKMLVDEVCSSLTMSFFNWVICTHYMNMNTLIAAVTQGHWKVC